MSGSGGSRSDWSDDGASGGGAATGGGGAGGGGTPATDPCLKVRRGPINSPRAAVLTPLKVGDVLKVRVTPSGTRMVLEVVDAAGNLGGSLTFVGYLEVIDCIISRGFAYQAVLISISGGIYEVRVEPV
ncbi:MAG: hypothetical protein HQL33_08685 [Alphaproteobacteria bacterium]|nr:hypothetical protein [Alphaproteobacteria bacterium]